MKILAQEEIEDEYNFNILYYIKSPDKVFVNRYPTENLCKLVHCKLHRYFISHFHQFHSLIQIIRINIERR